MSQLPNGSGSTSGPPPTKDKTKDWQLEMLMEKLRSKSAQYKSLPEISKNVRMTLLEKRYALDTVEKSQHQKCLDTLQHSIRVTSLQSMVERLESLTRQLGLKFVVEPSGVFISSDMFYLEIVLDPSGVVKDVKIHHEGKKEQQSCMELVNCLSRGDFEDFTSQLEGFTSIYQLNAEKKVKCKAFTALESLEADLSTLAQLQMFMKEPFNLIHKSPVGILEKRKGGHPMKLTYFVSPYDLLNVEKNEIDPIIIDNITSKGLGYSVTVCIEGSAAHKLQTTSLITINRGINGKNTPSYTSLTSQNSAVIPACFMLKLNKPLPMCLSLIRQIQQIHPWTDIDSAPVQPLLNLIVAHCSDNKMSSSNHKGLFVTLPDQNHCYFLTENKNMNGVLVSNIPFTHPAHVASILMILREQALFNTIIGSCVRPDSKQDFENMTMFEVSALSSTHISISLEHPIEESMATAEIDLTDASNLICRIHNPGTPPPVNAPDVASDLSTKILNKCFSIPVTLRSVIKLWEKQSLRRNHYGGHENFSLPLGSGDPGGHKDSSGPSIVGFGGLNDKIKQEPSGSSSHGMMMQASQSMFLSESMASNFQNFPPSEGVLANMELTNILSDTSDKSNKRQKRKLNEDSLRCGKRKVGTEDSDIMESNSCDSTSRSTPSSQETEIRTPNSILGFQMDNEVSGSDPAELTDTANKSNNEFENLSHFRQEPQVREKVKDEISTVALSDIEDKNAISSNVSITAIPASPTLGYAVNNVKEKRVAEPVTSSITITPVSSSPSKSSEEKSKEKKSRSSKDDKSRMDKKRRKKHDDSPMGPPEKVPHKQDLLNKPVTVSIKPAESPPPNSTPTSPNLLRKFNVSPTPNRTVSLSGKLSPNLTKPNLKSSSSSHQSPKNSPAHISSSPKHNISGISSPKHHGTSPKHPSTTGSGKPSMSTLKNAANSPSSKASNEPRIKSSLKDSRDKDKKASNTFGVNTKNKSSSLKVKSLDLNNCEVISDGLPSPSGTSDHSKTNPSQVKNRKSSLSAIVDKLKVNAQHCDTATDLSNKTSSNKERTSSSKSNESSKANAKLGETKNSEYMVKPSSDGMKITINKTRSKDSPSNKSSSSLSKGNTTGSPKTHTGLKPGVNSGPASKKPQQLQKSSSSSGQSLSVSVTNYASNNLKGSSSSNKLPSSGSSKVSSSSLSNSSNSSSTLSTKSGSKLSGSPKTTATDLSKSKDRLKLSKSSSEKSIFAPKDNRKSSPTPSRDEVDSVYKLSQSSLMDGRMKTLDKNFQIPKLSARTVDDKKFNKTDTLNSMNRNMMDSKMFDISKSDTTVSKYLGMPGNKLYDNAMELKVRNNVPMSLSMGDDDFRKRDVPHNFSNTQVKDNMKNLDTISSQSPYSTSTEPLSLSTKSIDLTSKFIVPAPKEDKKDLRKNDEVLDFSSKPQVFPQSPSVSVHIVKSPAPSPLISRSPHSASPCITDDELMDEALVGLGK
ncbi:mediator complex subunit 1 [Leptinotarsa decemlineata]|uniref:mediator complex subunit 1 n=1 Tax=Leptinotarsa decemlineata TaxID=7539 RepID=UPI003D30A48A